jgi:hypothetical protein
MSLGGDDGDKKLVLISSLGSLFNIQMLEFLLRIGQPGNQVPGGLNFVGFEVNNSLLQLSIEFIDQVAELLSNVSFLGTSTHVLELEFSLVIVISLSVPFSSLWVNSFWGS